MSGRFSIEALFKGTDGMSRVIAQVEGRVSTFSKSATGALKDIDKVNGKIIGGFSDLAKKAVAVGAVVGGLAGAALAHIGEKGAEFEQRITDVGAVMGKSRNQIQDLEKEALRLGVVTQFSSSEVAEAMEFMAKKGFDSEEILQGIPGVLNAIAASGQGMAEVATVVGSAIRGFGLDAGQAGHIANVLAFAAEKTGATITDLGSALATAAPTAKALGVSLEDTTTAVGLLQKIGIDASTAGSATATMLAKLSKPSKDAAQQMAAMGISFKDASGNMLPFRDVLSQFVKVGEKAGGNMNRMAFFAELVGLRGDKAALALSDMAKSGDFDKLSDGIRKVGNYAERVAKIRMDTTKGSWKLLLSTVEVLETKLFGLKSGALRGVIDSTNQWLTANQDLILITISDTLENATFAFQAFSRGATEGFSAAKVGLDLFLGPLGVLAGHFITAGTWPDKVKAIGTAFGFLGGVAILFGGFAVSVKIARGAMIAFEIAQRGVVAAVWLGNAAVTAYNFVTDSSTIATALNTGATAAGRLVLVASTAATWAKNTALAAAALTTQRFTLSAIANRVATAAVTAATWLWNTAQAAWTATTAIAGNVATAFKLATVASTEATVAGTEATVAAQVALGPLIATLGAAAAAVGTLMVAWDQWQKLDKQTNGLGIGGTISRMFDEGTFDPFKVIDEFGNEQARAEAARRDATPEVASPALSVSQSINETNTTSTGEVTIRDQTGRAAVTRQPASGFSLNLQPSGGM